MGRSACRREAKRPVYREVFRHQVLPSLGRSSSSLNRMHLAGPRTPWLRICSYRERRSILPREKWSTQKRERETRSSPRLVSVHDLVQRHHWRRGCCVDSSHDCMAEVHRTAAAKCTKVPICSLVMLCRRHCLSCAVSLDWSCAAHAFQNSLSKCMHYTRIYQWSSWLFPQRSHENGLFFPFVCIVPRSAFSLRVQRIFIEQSCHSVWRTMM